MRGLRAIFALLLGLALCGAAAAQTAQPGPFSEEDLDRLLAPVALYPDDLLAQVLMASTYPLEVVDADRWARAHPGLQGDALQAQLAQQAWDPSVKGLVAVPQVLAMMDERLDWTQKLGDAFLAQQGDVMAAVQRLRARAQAAGNLGSTPQQVVTSEAGAIDIAPASPDVVYVPVYDPAIVFGPWWWPLPPYYWYPPGYVPGGPGIYFGVAFVVGAAIWGICDWPHRTVLIDTRRYAAFARRPASSPVWTHDIVHRRGVPYRDDATRARFGRALPGAQERREFRGFAQPAPAAAPPASAARPAPALRPAPAAPAAVARPAAPSAVARPAPQARPAPPAFESFGRGDAAREYQRRGAESRAPAAPHRVPSTAAPSRAPAAAPAMRAPASAPRAPAGGAHGGAPGRR